MQIRIKAFGVMLIALSLAVSPLTAEAMPSGGDHGKQSELIPPIPPPVIPRMDPDSATIWAAFEYRGPTIYSAPAVASMSSNTLEVFYISSSGHVRWKRWNGSIWYTPAEQYQPDGDALRLHGSGDTTVYSAPAAVSWGSGRLDLFIRGTDSYLYHNAYNASVGYWEGWQQLRGASGLHIYSAPTVASWAPGRLDVFAVSYSNTVIQLTYSGGAWSDWTYLFIRSLQTVIEPRTYVDPAAVSWGSNRIDVFVTGEDHGLYHRPYASGWIGGWGHLFGSSDIYSAPAAASWSSGRLDVFWVSSFGFVFHVPYTVSGGWKLPAEFLGGQSFDRDVLYEAPGAVSWGSGRIDVFLRGKRPPEGNSALYQAWWT